MTQPTELRAARKALERPEAVPPGTLSVAERVLGTDVVGRLDLCLDRGKLRSPDSEPERVELVGLWHIVVPAVVVGVEPIVELVVAAAVGLAGTELLAEVAVAVLAAAELESEPVGVVLVDAALAGPGLAEIAAAGVAGLAVEPVAVGLQLHSLAQEPFAVVGCTQEFAAEERLLVELPFAAKE